MKVNKIISGGQTGADRAALDFALENNIKMGGFVPKDRRAEDGRIPDKYSNLTETETLNYAERTELNILEADATIILSHGELQGGSLLTKQLAENHNKPFLHIDFLETSIESASFHAKAFLKSNDCEVLNVAGSRASGDAEIYAKTREFLTVLFK